MNLADALKKLYTKLGGTDALPQGTDTCTLVDKIADEVSGGGSSGGGALYIPIIETETETQHVFTLSGYTYNRLMEALENGKSIYATHVNMTSNATEIIPLESYRAAQGRFRCSIVFGGQAFSAPTQDEELGFAADKEDEGETS